LQAAAVAMANALSSRAADGTGHGAYRSADVPLYQAFQRAAGVKADGWPGAGTMGKLASVLASVPMPMPSVPIFPWKKGPGWGGKNAPALSDWNA
jgi:hypothetical protein